MREDATLGLLLLVKLHSQKATASGQVTWACQRCITLYTRVAMTSREWCLHRITRYVDFTNHTSGHAWRVIVHPIDLERTTPYTLGQHLPLIKMFSVMCEVRSGLKRRCMRAPWFATCVTLHMQC